MTNLNSLRLLLFSFLASLNFFTGCIGADPPTPDNYVSYPLDVRTDELPDGSFRLRWNAIKSADFIGYQVIRNIGDSVPFVPNNKISLTSLSLNLELLRQIESPDSTFFIDSFTVATTKTYVRVFAVLKDRNLSSRNVEMPIKSDAKEMNLTPNDVLFIPEEKALLIGDHNGTLLGTFNTGLNTPVGITQGVAFTSNTEMAYGRFNGISEIYIPTPFQIVLKNLTTPNFISFLPSVNNTDAVMYDKTSNIYFTTTALPTIVRSFGRSANSPSAIYTTTFPTIRNQSLYVLRPAPLNREAIALSNSPSGVDLIWFKYDADGRNIVKLSGLNTLSLNITKRPFAIASDNQFFLTGTKGLIFNRNATLVDSLKLPEPQVRYHDMIFSDDGTRIYAIRNAIENRKERLVDVFKYPNFQFEKSLPFKSNPSRVFQDGTNLILVGRSPNNAKRTMIEKIKWQ